MENSVEKKHGVSAAPKRSRSLDTLHFYEEKSPASAGRSRSENGDLAKRKRRSADGLKTIVGQSRRKSKGRKEISLSNFTASVKKRRRDRHASDAKSNVFVSSSTGKPQPLSPDGSSSVLHDLDNSSGASLTSSDRIITFLGKKKKLKSDPIAQNDQHLPCLGGDLVIPKRPRGVLRRKKSDSSLLSERTHSADQSNSVCKSTTANANNVTLSSDSVIAPSVSVNKQKWILEPKESSSNRDKRGVLVEVVPSNEGEGIIAGKANQRKVVRNHRKRRYSTSEKHGHLEDEEIFVQKSNDHCGDLHDDEEENLEENAARMLSSRFDPTCTGFSGGRTSPLELVNGFAVYPQSFSADSNGLGSKISSVDDAGRMLRPRRRNGKNAVRKRRHFYEVCAREMDPYWVLNQRIRVFWPLDQSWYFGLVKDYNPVNRLHHVKYDDREEEWIDLQNERFKLLMFPSEYTGKCNLGRPILGTKQKSEDGGESDEKNDCASSFMESEPIISWLVRSNHRMKPTPLNILKEKRRSHLNKHSIHPLFPGPDPACPSHVDSKETISSVEPNIAIEEDNQLPIFKSETDSVDRRFSFFYSRRRFHKTRKVFHSAPVGDSASRSFFGIQFPGAHEFDITMGTVKLKQGIPGLRLPLPRTLDLVFLPEIFQLFSMFWRLQFGRLMLLWPKVHMTIFFLDNSVGLRIVSFEGCLRHAVALLCLIMRIFHQPNSGRNLLESQFPFTSIGFRLSGLQEVGRHLLVSHYFWEIESSKWAYLDHKLKKYCILTREIPRSQCTYESVKSNLERSGLMPLAPVCWEPVESNFFLDTHLKLLMKNKVSFGSSQNENAMSAQDCQETLDKLTDDGCSPADDSSFLDGISSPDKSDDGDHSSMDTMNCETQQLNQEEARLLDREKKATSTSDLVWKVNDSALRGLKPIAFRSASHHNRKNPLSPSFGYRSQVWPEDYLRDGFVNGYRKPRTRVSYSSPFGGYHFGSEPQSHRHQGRAYKKIRTDNGKKTTTVSRSPQHNVTSLTCEANVLVTEGDRGWREYAAQILLESDDQEWKISVKLSGATRYSYKAHQFLQPGTTNRYTHAMMWKGGKDWTLEFNDRSQWAIFKELHEDCYNRNIRAASVKNIPIPGVCLIEDNGDYAVEVPFIRSSSKYIRQVGTEVDVAMDPSHVLYDMDSDDEEWISKLRSSSGNDGNIPPEISEDMYEKAIDMFEKFAYAQQCDEFTDAEIESFMAEVGPLNAIRSIHERWLSKRQKKGMALIRQFQPPLWERYQKQLKEWELAVSKITNSSNGSQEKGSLLEKPPMFAFCLKPRGLEVPNKGSKQRSHKKLTVTGNHSMFSREQDSPQGFGRKLNGFCVGDDKALITVLNVDSSESSMWLQSPTGFSPSESVNNALANGGLERNQNLKLHRSSSKRMGMFSSHGDFQMTSTSFNRRTKRAGFSRWNTGFPEWSSTKHIQSDGFQRHHADVEEFRLRDASSAAQHALNMAKLKREKAQWLLHKADLALHKAVVALMTAEAMKASERDLIGEG